MVEAGSVIRRARQAAGLGQRALGARAGVPQSAVSAYESGRTQPSVPVLARLVEAAGFELDLQLKPLQDPPGRVFVGPVGRKVQRRRTELRQLLAGAGFARPEVFGSVARGEDQVGSDLDVLVDVPTEMGLFALAAARGAAEELLGVPVDLVPRDGLKTSVATEIGQDLVVL